VWCQRREQRVAGPVVYLETAPGVGIVAAAWILDPAACAGMAFGAPRVVQAALVDLHHLLIGQGFRRSSRDDPTIIPEEPDMPSLPTPPPSSAAAPRQLSLSLDSAKLRGMTPADRGAALALLARLLMEAAGVAATERDDDER
jgi:hypothetical protein